MTAVPKELTYELPPTLSGLSSYELRVPTYTTLNSFNQPNAVAQLQIPQIPNTWMDPSTSYLSIQVTLAVEVKANLVAANTNACMLGSGGWSLFNRIQTYFNSGVLLEDLQNPNIFVNAWRNLTQNRADKFGDAAVFGGNDLLNTSNVGTIIGGLGCYAWTTAPGANVGDLTQQLKFSIPIPGYMGMGSAGRLIPLFCGPHRIDLSLDAVRNWFAASVANDFPGAANATISFDRLEFVTQAIQLSDPMQNLILSALPNAGQISIRSNQISTTTVVLPTGSSGMAQYLVGTRVSSCKAMLLTFNPTQGCGDGIYASVCPNLASLAHEINGSLFPRQLADMTKGPDSFARILQCLGVFSSTGDKPSVSTSEFFVGTAAGVPSTPFRAPTATVALLLANNPSNCFFHLMDLEVFGSKGSGSGFFSGQNTTSGSNFLRINYSAPINQVFTVYAFTIHDCVVTYDIAAQTAVRRI